MREILSCLMTTSRNRAQSQQNNDPPSLSSRIPTKNPDLSNTRNMRNLYIATLLLLATLHSSVWLSFKIVSPGVMELFILPPAILLSLLFLQWQVQKWRADLQKLWPYASSFQTEVLKNTMPCRRDYRGRNSASWNFTCTKRSSPIMLMKVYSKWFNVLDHNDTMPHLWRKWNKSIE